MKNDFILCSCHDLEHMMIIGYDDVPDKFFYQELYVHTHLQKRPFWQRVVYAVKYIFGRQSRYGAFTEYVFEEKQAIQMRDAINGYLEKLGEYRKNVSD